MLPSRFGLGQPSAVRKSRLDGKPSLLPKPRRPVSTDRLSSEAHRPSAPGYRSSSVEAARATIGAGRLSREYSATKMPLNARSRSQQNDRFGQSSMTPLQSNPYSRATTTPRTPSEDQYTRNWQTCLDRALAFVTAKDQRPVSNVGWQRAQCARAAEALTERGVQAPLVRPLTIARFVEIVNALLCPMMGDAKLNTDNYVTKLPHLAKRVLYPGILSKSWLKTVNTLHAFPQALAFIVYLQDIVDHIETPVSDEWLYGGKDPISCLRRDYLRKCWIRFQDPEYQFEDLNEEYLRNLKALLGNDEEKINQLSQVIKQYEECLEDEVEAAARADEARRAERREQLIGAVRAQRAQTRADGALLQDTRALNQQNLEAVSQLELEIERATVENQELKCQLEAQMLTVEQRAKLLDDIDYANRVHDSKRDLIDKISKMVLSKEAELTLWQTKTLDSCVGFKQGLIHLSAQFPDLASLAVDEKDLMSAECAAWVSRGVECLRARQAELAEQRAEHARQRAALGRQRAALLEETRSKVSEIRSAVEREREALDIEYSKETTEAAAWGAELRELTARMDVLLEQQQEYAKVDTELDFWEKQDAGWRSKLSELQNYIHKQREETKRVLEEARLKRARRVLNMVRDLKEQVGL